MPLRIVFLGTPAFAVPALETLHAHPDLCRVVGVITQPDRGRGRGQQVAAGYVKEVAVRQGTPLLQPERLRGDTEALAQVAAWQPDLGIVVSFGQIIPRALLAVPRLGMINVHASLLPRWRGASPINRALLNGDAETGVCIMKIEPKLDAGPVLMELRTPIGADDDAISLADRLARLGADALPQALQLVSAGTATWTPQDETRVTYAGLLRKEDGAINWNRPAHELRNLVRGLVPWPTAYTTLAGKRLQVWKAHLLATPAAAKTAAGTIVAAKKEFCVATGDGVLALDEVQLEGRSRLAAAPFLAGMRADLTGTVLGA